MEPGVLAALFRLIVRRAVVIHKDTQGITIGVIILATGERPEQHQKTAEADQQGGCNNQRHGLAFPPASRRALRVTSREDPAMVAAATSGVTRPSAAMGMAVTL